MDLLSLFIHGTSSGSQLDQFFFFLEKMFKNQILRKCFTTGIR